jgi:hypothetical protein
MRPYKAPMNTPAARDCNKRLALGMRKWVYLEEKLIGLKREAKMNLLNLTD